MRARAERLEELVERVHDEPERELPLELGGVAVQRQAAAAGGAQKQLAEQARLADPGLTAYEQEARLARGRPLEHSLDELQFGQTTHKVGWRGQPSGVLRRP